jgi:hypothetical protein
LTTHHEQEALRTLLPARLADIARTFNVNLPVTVDQQLARTHRHEYSPAGNGPLSSSDKDREATHCYIFYRRSLVVAHSFFIEMALLFKSTVTDPRRYGSKRSTQMRQH